MDFSPFVRRVVHVGASLVLAVLASTSVTGAQQASSATGTTPAAIFVTWNGDPTTTVSVDWHLAADTDIPAIEVRGPGLSTWKRYQGSTIVFPFSSRTVRRARIDGLHPGSVYELRLGDARSYKYRTMPAVDPRDRRDRQPRGLLKPRHVGIDRADDARDRGAAG